MYCACLILVLGLSFFLVNSHKQATTFHEWFDNLNEDDIPSLNLVNFNQKNYYFEVGLKASYLQAQFFCKYHGMNLVSITSKEINDFLTKQAQATGTNEPYFWTSGARLSHKHWTWMSTGRPVKYFNWIPGEPNNDPFLFKNVYLSEFCLEVRETSGGLQFNDLGCWKNLYFICEADSSYTSYKNCEILTVELDDGEPADDEKVPRPVRPVEKKQVIKCPKE